MLRKQVKIWNRIPSPVLILLCLCSFAGTLNSARKSLYDALASSDTLSMNKPLAWVSKLESPYKQAYRGALLMRKSEFLPTPRQKIQGFTQGQRLLESAIKLDSLNGEFRFLRLLIQEHCPPILRYKQHIQQDVSLVVKSYPTFDPELKTIVRKYAQTSEHLKIKDL